MKADNSGRWETGVGLPETRFALATGDVNIGYQVLGDGPVDLVWAWGGFSNIEVMWEEPSFAAFLRRLSEFSRLILFDRRGSGVSDRGGTATTPTLEERMEDILAIMDAVGSEKACIAGVSEGGNLAALFSATYPERTASIILYATPARFRKDEENPWGFISEDEENAFIEMIRKTWGEKSEQRVALWAPSMLSDEAYMKWQAKFGRQSVSRDAVVPLFRSAFDYDLVDIFPAVRVPALVLHRLDDRLVSIAQSRRVAEQIPNARFVELEGIDHLPFVGDSEAVLAAIESFLLGSAATAPRHRKLLTVTFTDIAESTQNVQRLGDAAWRELIAAHDRIVRDHLARFGGQEVKQLGDGFLAVFEGPARAIRCLLGIVDASARFGLSVRAGLHTGECDVVDSDVQGIAVHVARRIADQARPGQILASSTVADLVAGSGIRFGEARDAELEGIAGTRYLLEVLTRGANPDAVRKLAIEQANVLRRDGEYWTVAYDGMVVTLRDTKGMRDIARLLASPRRELHALDLAGSKSGGKTSISNREISEAGLSATDVRSNEPLIDDAARPDYKRRISELEQEVEEAEGRGDTEATAKARKELDVLVHELASSYGLHGRARQTPDHVERARKAVTRRIRDALSRIDRAHPSLGRHLNASIRTGVFCSYEPERDITWAVEGTGRHKGLSDP